MNPCKLIEDTNILDVVREMWSLSEKDGVERGVYLYDKNGDIMVTNIQSGDGYSIAIDMPTRFFGLVPDGDPIATIHTHPHEEYDTYFSIQDFRSMINGDLEFSVSVFDKGGHVMADVFMPKEYSQFEELAMEHINSATRLDFIKAANEELLRCTLDLGEK